VHLLGADEWRERRRLEEAAAATPQ
jgi:hypothetical protein